jgi:predicted PurR-regulated permease PerM
MPQGKWFRIGYGIIIILLIAYLASLVDYLFNPIGAVLAALFVPIVISGFFYYLFRPFVRMLERKLPLTLSIVIIYLAVVALLVLSSWLIWPPIRDQSTTLVNNFPDII